MLDAAPPCRISSRVVLLPPLLVLALVASAPARAQDPTPSEPSPGTSAEGAAAPTFEEQARELVLGRQIGPGTVADLALSDAFLERVGDRIIRAEFDRRVGIVVPDPGSESALEADFATAGAEGSTGAGPDKEPVPKLFPLGYAALALGVATWFALRARKGAA